MKKVVMLADASNIHTQKWALFLSEYYDITVISLLPYKSEFYNVITIPSKSYQKRKNNLEYNKFKVLFESLIFIRKILRKIKPDLLHAHFASSYGLMGALSGYKPFIVSVWGYDTLIFPYKSIVNKILIKFVLERCNVILATSKFLAIETQRLTKKHIRLTPFGVDINSFKPIQKTNNEKFIIGITKSLRLNYGYDILFEAVQKFASEVNNFELHIIGAGEDEDEIRKISLNLGIAKRVIFFGKIAHDLIPEYVSKFSIAVFPSKGYESFGVSAVEAAACGIPLIVSDLGGLPEIVQDGINGFTVPVGDSQILFEKMFYIYQNQNAARLMGLKGRDYVVNNYNWIENAERMNEIYNEILKD